MPAAAANLNTGRIAIAQSPTSSDYYAKTAWTDRAPLMVQTRIVDSFENSRKIVAVARESIGLRANYVLQPDLRNFEAMYFYGGRRSCRSASSPSWCACPTGRSSASATFERCVRARADKVPKVVEAFDQALGSVMKRLVVLDAAHAAAARRRAKPAATTSTRYRNPANAIDRQRELPQVATTPRWCPLTDE